MTLNLILLIVQLILMPINLVIVCLNIKGIKELNEMNKEILGGRLDEGINFNK